MSIELTCVIPSEYLKQRDIQLRFNGFPENSIIYVFREQKVVWYWGKLSIQTAPNLKYFDIKLIWSFSFVC